MVEGEFDQAKVVNRSKKKPNASSGEERRKKKAEENSKAKANNDDATRLRLQHLINSPLSHLQDMNENICKKLSHILDDPPHRSSLFFVSKSDVKSHWNIVEQPSRQFERRGLKNLLQVLNYIRGERECELQSKGSDECEVLERFGDGSELLLTVAVESDDEVDQSSSRFPVRVGFHVFGLESMLDETEVERSGGTGNEDQGGRREIESGPAVVVSGIEDFEERKKL